MSFMLNKRIIVASLINAAKNLSTSQANHVKVAIIGASGGIGQPTSLLLKQTPFVTQLSLYDVQGTAGVAADLSHIDSPTKVAAYTGNEQLHDCLKGANIVLITAGNTHQVITTREDQFDGNAEIVCNIAEACAETCPGALVAIVTNPVNSLVPLFSDVLQQKGVYDPNKIFGVTTIDLVRASTFVAELKDLDPLMVEVPVVGGHSTQTIVPLFCKTKPPVKWTKEQIECLSKRVQEAGMEVIRAKDKKGSSTLCMAYAATRFVQSLCRGLKREPNILETSYVRSNVTEAKYMSTPLCLGPNGVHKNLGLPKLSEYENELLQIAYTEIKKNVVLGEDYVKSGCKPKSSKSRFKSGSDSSKDVTC